jgi:hypothetical protein
MCIPSSVETIGEFCFRECQSLSDLTFEAGSAISHIGNLAFTDCWSLPSICIPAGLRQLTGLALADSGIDTVTVEAGNEFFKVRGDYVVDFEERCLVRYFGNDDEL